MPCPPAVRQANCGVHSLDEVHRGHLSRRVRAARHYARIGLPFTAPARILLYSSCQPAGPPGIGINGRKAMNLSRRDLAAAGVLVLGAAAFAGPGLANAEDEAAVKKAVEELKAAWLNRTRRRSTR